MPFNTFGEPFGQFGWNQWNPWHCCCPYPIHPSINGAIQDLNAVSFGLNRGLTGIERSARFMRSNLVNGFPTPTPFF